VGFGIRVILRIVIARSEATTQSPVVTTIHCHCEAHSAEATSIHIWRIGELAGKKLAKAKGEQPTAILPQRIVLRKYIRNS